MKIFNLDIYRKDWLDTVFAMRNQAYGAYELRRTAGSSMNKALFVVVTAVILAIGSLYAFDKKPSYESIMVVELDETLTPEDLLTEEEEEEILELPTPEEQAPQQIAQDLPAIDLIRYPEATVVESHLVKEELATQDDLKDKMSARLTLSRADGGTTVPTGEFGSHKVEGAITGVLTENNVKEGEGYGSGDIFINVQVMPEPVGGMKAFIEWVAKNYNFPQSALDNQIQGVIDVSFVVETDGSLTDIKIKRDMGYGTGNEALKLLKKAKKWNAGIQNGRAVRVAFTMPIRLSTVSQ